MAEGLYVETSESTKAWSVTVRGEVDIDTAPQLKEVLDGAVEGGTRLVVLDLEQVDFLDSSGLRVILASSNHLRAVDGALVVEGASPAVLQVLETTGVIEQLRRSRPN